MSKKLFFTPGPSQLYHTFEEHFKRGLSQDVGSISHRSTAFVKIVKESTEALRELLEVPDSYSIFFLNSANEAWDRILENLVIEHSHHFVNGYFSQKFYDFAIQRKLKSTQTKVAYGNAYPNFSIPENAELIGITKNETSVGFDFTESEITEIRRNNPEKLIALDIVSAAPGISIDLSNVDSAYFSVQKGFGMPPGLGVWIVNEKCLEKADRKLEKTSIGTYRSLPTLQKFYLKDQTPETPNAMHIYVLGKIAADLITFGRTRLRNETSYKSVLLNQMVSTHPHLSHFVPSESNHSKTTIVANCAKADAYMNELRTKHIELGNGYGQFKGQHLRFANFPAHSKEAVEQLVDIMNGLEL